MMSSYNSYYQKENYFGNPYPELLEYFESIDRSKNILDLGCGQGRDSLALGRMGFNVIGIDISSVGIEQMNETAERENLLVRGYVSDLHEYQLVSHYDIVLLDSMFHFYKNDVELETSLLLRLLFELKSDGELVIIVQESPLRIKYMKKVINESEAVVRILHERSFIYKEYGGKFYMIVLKKE